MKRIIAGLVILLVGILINAVLADSHRITVLETEMKAIKDSLVISREEVTAARLENTQEHAAIRTQLVQIAVDLAKISRAKGEAK